MSVSGLDMERTETIALVLVLVGALNWGLIGLGGFLNSYGNILGVGIGFLGLLIGSAELFENGLYLLIGLAGLYTGYLRFWK